MAQSVQYHIVFHGEVQGVGFRFTARELALRYGLDGWVRNDSDGTVECVAEGDPLMLGLFLEDIRDHFRGNLTDIEIDEREPAGAGTGFGVRY
jgi:acylphosphatase